MLLATLPSAAHQLESNIIQAKGRTPVTVSDLFPLKPSSPKREALWGSSLWNTDKGDVLDYGQPLHWARWDNPPQATDLEKRQQFVH